MYDSKHVFTRPVVLGPVVALAVWHIHAVAETHKVLGVPFLTVANNPTAVELLHTAVAVRRGRRPVATDVQDEMSWAISQEIWQVWIVLVVGVRILYVQLHIPANADDHVVLMCCTSPASSSARLGVAPAKQRLRCQPAHRKWHSGTRTVRKPEIVVGVGVT